MGLLCTVNRGCLGGRAVICYAMFVGMMNSMTVDSAGI